MARVLAISSLVARGHVGLSAVMPALQALGHEVTVLPTVLLSNHPGHRHAAGERIAPATLARMLDALAANGWLAEVDALCTGYLPSPAHVALAADAIDRVRAATAGATILVDAVIGDLPKGIYVESDAAEALRATLVPRAGILKGNAFEIGWLVGRDIAAIEDVVSARASLQRPLLLATSVPAARSGDLANVLAGSAAAPCAVSVAARSGVPKGTGDLLAGLFLGHLLAAGPSSAPAGERCCEALARATADLDRVVLASLGAEELRLTPLLAPGHAQGGA